MVVRDIDLLVEASRRTQAIVTFSIPTLDDRIWRTTEPSTAPPAQRLRALTRLREAGIAAGVGMAPLLPGLSDDPILLGNVVRAARDAGATHLWWNHLNLRPGTREHFLESLARDWPEAIGHYERLYADGAYLRPAVTRPTDRVLASLREHAPMVGRRPRLTVDAG